MCAHLAFTLIFLLHWTEKGINSGILASRLLGGGGGQLFGCKQFHRLEVHFIPKWWPINYSFVCMLITLFASFSPQQSFV